MTSLDITINEKLLAQGWIISNGQRLPPPGMGGFAAQEVLERVRREAEGEASETEAPRTDVWPDKAYWHSSNPWKDELIYVPIEELAACVVFIDRPIQTKDGPVTASLQFVLDMWRSHGSKLDAYILTGRTFTAGVRFGPDGPDYLSPGFSTPKLWALKLKYGARK